MKEKSGNGIIWLYALILALLAISKFTGDPAPTVDLYKVSTEARPKINAAIEKADINREAHGQAPLSEEEIQDIAHKEVQNAIRRLNNK